MRIDVDVDFVGYVDVRRLPAKAQLAAEEEQQHEHYDDEKHDREDSAAPTTAAGFHHGRVFAFYIVAIIGHGNSPVFPCCIGETNEPVRGGFPNLKGAGMRRNAVATWIGLLALSACNRTVDKEAPTNAKHPAKVTPNDTQPPVPPPATGPNARTPLAEPNGPIDPKSSEAAGQVVQHYGALIEQRRFAEARALWGAPNSAAQFESRLKKHSEVHLEIGNPGDMEGAAGSIYITVPIILYGDTAASAPFKCNGAVTLRRVNDVPGSTEAQRRWHISNIECEPL